MKVINLAEFCYKFACWILKLKKKIKCVQKIIIIIFKTIKSNLICFVNKVI